MLNIPIRDDAFCDLADEDEEQDEGEEPAEVVTRKVEPGAVVDVDLGALATPTFNGSSELKYNQSETERLDRE